MLRTINGYRPPSLESIDGRIASDDIPYRAESQGLSP